MKQELQTADTIVSQEREDELSLSRLPDWKGLLGVTLGEEAHATLVLSERNTLKPLGTQSIRLGSRDLPLPQHTISPESEVVDFSIISTLGRGGMGVVHLARQNALAREVAIKQLLPDTSTPLAQQNLLREACITGRLEHPNIVPVYSLGIDEQGRPLFVMKRIEGISWYKTLSNPELLPRIYAQFDDIIESHLEILEQVCLALHYAHSRGIIHRDLKPENVMLGEYGEVYVVDWGIAVSLLPDEHGILPLASEADQVVGTPMYMAPEQAAAQASLLGTHTDVYALGAILHELMTGSPRHQGSTLQAVLLKAYASSPAVYGEEVSAQLGKICNRACAREPSQRYASAEALREDVAIYRNQRRADELLEATAHRLHTLAKICAAARAQSSISAEQMVEAYALVGACRFGLEQALKIKPEDTSIEVTRHEVLNTMLALEILHENIAASRILQSELGVHLSAQNRAALAALELQLEREHERIAMLKRLEHDVDFSVSRKQKGVFALALCAVWGGASMLLNTFIGEAQTVNEVYIGATSYKVLVSAMVFVMWLGARRAIRMTPINRKLINSVPIVLIFGLAVRLMAWRFELQLYEAIAMELVCYALVGTMLGSVLDRALYVTSVIYVLGACSILFDMSSAYASPTFAVCNIAALAFVSWRWFSGRGSLTSSTQTT